MSEGSCKSTKVGHNTRWNQRVTSQVVKDNTEFVGHFWPPNARLTWSRRVLSGMQNTNWASSICIFNEHKESRVKMLFLTHHQNSSVKCEKNIWKLYCICRRRRELWTSIYKMTWCGKAPGTDELTEEPQSSTQYVYLKTKDLFQPTCVWCTRGYIAHQTKTRAWSRRDLF